MEQARWCNPLNLSVGARPLEHQQYDIILIFREEFEDSGI